MNTPIEEYLFSIPLELFEKFRDPKTQVKQRWENEYLVLGAPIAVETSTWLILRQFGNEKNILTVAPYYYFNHGVTVLNEIELTVCAWWLLKWTTIGVNKPDTKQEMLTVTVRETQIPFGPPCRIVTAKLLLETAILAEKRHPREIPLDNPLPRSLEDKPLVAGVFAP